MGKGDRRKRNKLDLPGLAPVPKRETDGKSTRRKRTAEVIEERDVGLVVLERRARHMGEDKGTADEQRAARSKMRAQPYGEAAGMAIYAIEQGDTAARLWGVWTALTAAERTYTGRVLGMSPNPKTAKLETMPERFEARADDNPDLRTEEEKHRDAVNAWAKWQDAINSLPLGTSSILWSVMRGWRDTMDDGKITQFGRAFVQALRDLDRVT